MKKIANPLRLVSLALVFVMVLGCLAGCAPAGNPSGTTGNPTPSLTDPPQTDPPQTDPPQTDPPQTDPPETNPPETTLPGNVPLSAREIAALAQAATVTVSVDCGDYGTSAGTGFFIDSNGTLITNYHVIDGAVDIEVEFYGGGIYEVMEIVDFDELHDVAILRINYTGNPYLEICEDGVVTGETIYANGSSLGVLEGSFTDGIVSSQSRKVGSIDCIQITAPISNGNSGGPLLNEYGQVVGINSYGYSNGQNLNLAINIDIVNTLSLNKNWTIKQYMQWYDKEVDRSYLVYDFDDEGFYLSKVHTYHLVTGRDCICSSDHYDLTDAVNGYEEFYFLYVYEYLVDEFDQYCDYLMSIGFEYEGREEYATGISYFYVDSFNGYIMDLFIMDGEYLFIELSFG